jgi:beta-phosphoglucomutase-like phosphatase (HAD superfamily)
MAQVINLIFIVGWYISAVLFSIQAVKIYKAKSANGVSLVATFGFFLLNVNSTLWMYSHQEYLSILATVGISLASLVSFLLALKYGNRESKYDAVIFDLDGVLFDTQTSIHATAECQTLANYEIMMKPEEISNRFAGIPTNKIFEEIAPHLSSQELVDAKWKLVREILSTTHPEPIDSIIRLLAYLKLKKMPIIIASASPRWYIELLLEKNIGKSNGDVGIFFRHTPLKNYFQKNFVSAEEVAKPKPAPDVFLESARQLGVNPKKCLVIGDGKSDVRGGVAAGMDVLFLGQVDEEIERYKNVLSFSKSTDLVAYLLKQQNLF